MGLADTGDGRTSAARRVLATTERGGPAPWWCMECGRCHTVRWAVRWLRGRVCRACVRRIGAEWLANHPEEAE